MANNPNEVLQNLSTSTSSLSDISSDDESEKFSDSELLQKIVPEEVSTVNWIAI